MKKNKLLDNIRDMEAVYNDDTTPSEIKETLKEGIENAKKELAKLDKKQTSTAGVKKKIPISKTKTAAVKKSGDSNLARCKEIIAKYKKQQVGEKKRIAKRVRQGKPAELTVSETLKKAAKVVKNKVETVVEKKGKVSQTEMDAAINQIVGIIRSIVDKLESKKQKTAFIKSVLMQMSELSVKAEKGIVLDDGLFPEDVPDTTASGNMRILSYRTQNFDISPHAQQLFDSIRNNENWTRSPNNKVLVEHIAMHMDIIFEIAKIAKTRKVHSTEFNRAVSALMLIMYDYGAIFNQIPEDSSFTSTYPTFLLAYLNYIALNLEDDVSPVMAAWGKRLTSAINRDRAYQSGEPWERDYVRSSDPKHPHYLAEGGHTKPGGSAIEISFKRPLSGEEIKKIMSQNILVTGEGHNMLFIDNSPSKPRNQYDIKAIVLEAVNENIIVKIVKKDYAKGGKIQIDPAYKWFAMNEKNNKIVAGYEDREDVTDFIKQAKEVNPGLNLVGYSLAYLKRIKVDPFNVGNWSNELAAGGMKAMFGNILTVNGPDNFAIAHDNAGV